MKLGKTKSNFKKSIEEIENEMGGIVSTFFKKRSKIGTALKLRVSGLFTFCALKLAVALKSNSF